MTVKKIPAVVTEQNEGLTPKLSGANTEYLDGTGVFSTPAGSGGAPATDEFITVVDETGTLPNSRQLVNGTNTTIDTTTPGQIKVNASGASGAPANLTYITEDTETADLPNSFKLTAGNGITLDTSTPNVMSIAAVLGGRLLNVRFFDTPGAGTYTPTAGTNLIIIELQGGGGGGGGTITGSASNSSMSVAGTSGSYLFAILTADFSGAGYVVGDAGAGGAAGANVGTAGGDTTFTDTSGSPVTYTAGGGSGGNAGTLNLTGGPPAQRVPFGTPGVASNGLINIPGGYGSPGIAMNTIRAFAMKGADSLFGNGGHVPQIIGANASIAGNPATGYGAGGSGSFVQGTGASVAGGNGAKGFLKVWEFS